jgi:hypothetical protein
VLLLTAPALAGAQVSADIARAFPATLDGPVSPAPLSDRDLATIAVPTSPMVDADAAQVRTAADRRHVLGIGGRVGGFTLGIGASARYWNTDAIALQVDFSHYGVTGIGLTQIAPSVLFILGQPDLSKPTQVRPYVGGGVSIFRVTDDDIFSDGASDTGLGGQGFAGVEVVFAAMPNFGVSGDIGYYSTGTFFGVSVGGIAISVAGHYYFK